MFLTEAIEVICTICDIVKVLYLCVTKAFIIHIFSDGGFKIATLRARIRVTDVHVVQGVSKESPKSEICVKNTGRIWYLV